MRVAVAIELTDQERATLDGYARGRSTPARLVLRAKIVLQAAKGRQNKEIAEDLGTLQKTVGLWRNRFAKLRIAGIEKDAPGRGRPKTIGAKKVADIVRITTQETPPNATQWSTRDMAKASEVSASTVRRIWREHGLKPHVVRGFKVSRDPEFAEKLGDVVGLYLNPPANAIVLSCDEKSQIQALDRTQPSLPLSQWAHEDRYPRLQAQRELDSLRGAEHPEREGAQHVRAAPSSSGVAPLPLDDRPRDAGAPRDPRDRRQLRDAQARQGGALACTAPALPHALHADQCVLAQHGRALQPRHHDEAHPTRGVPERRGAGPGHRELHRRAQP
jgi:transposase